LLGFVDVLGRGEGHDSHRRRERDTEEARRGHEGDAMPLPTRLQLKTR